MPRARTGFPTCAALAWFCLAGPAPVAQTCDPPDKIGLETFVGQGGEASIVWNGSEYGVAWAERFGAIFKIAFRRLGRDGDWLGDTVPITEGPISSHQPSLAWTGSQWGLAWADDRGSGGTVRFRRLDAQGVKIGSEFELRGEGTQYPILLWADPYFFAAVRAGSEVKVIRFLTESSRVEFDLGDDTGPLYSFAWNGSQFSVVYGYRFRRFDALMRPLGQPVNLAGTPDYTGVPASVTWRRTTHLWNGSRYVAALSLCHTGGDRCPLVFRVLDAEGNPESFVEAIGVAGDTVRAPDVVWTGKELLGAWQYEEGDGTWIGRFHPDGQPKAPAMQVTLGTAWQQGPRIGWNGADFVLTLEPSGQTGNAVWYARIGCNCVDGDGDGVSLCNDCDDTSARVFPGAPELCDGRANDCNAPGWPDVPADEVDLDDDGFSICAGDCDDGNRLRSPLARESCNAIDDDCNGLVDDDDLGQDSDEDAVSNACDNCREDFNPEQDDADRDGVGNACDNCLFAANPGQLDRDQDLEGDVCDNDDGFIYVRFRAATSLTWQPEAGFDRWNVYSGDLAVLRDGGAYTQAAGSNRLASRTCGLTAASLVLEQSPVAGSAAFYLVSGSSAGVEGDLGVDGGGAARPNTNPCP